MKALFYHCNCGISGDMNLAALIDIGVPEAFLSAELSKLSMDQEFRLVVTRAEKMGIWGTRVEVVLGHSHDHHHHSHEHEHEHHHHHAPHRTYRDICQIIDDSPYNESIKATTHAVFKSIGEAEAKIHGKSLEDIHFHEVGATDSIVDIFGAAIALDYLNVSTVLCAPVELGGGHVKCAHGVFPVPAPATAEILSGVPCRFGTVDGEATTPTGAAILKSTVNKFEPKHGFAPEKIGYGIGHRDFGIPNVLRVMLGDYQATAQQDLQLPQAPHYEIVTNIDDMSPEAFEPLLDCLFDAGASDVFLTPIIMKKSRLAQMVTVLCKADDRERLTDVLLENSSTIGVRIHPVYKQILPRSLKTITTSYGEVNVKIVNLPNGENRWKVEHDHVVRIAREQGLAYREVRAAIEQEVNTSLEASP
ncbi:MAG: nickel pincer cofactor biosynthesis protein LarC [Pseudomonadota bacterium]